MVEWTAADDRAAYAEGWGVFDSGVGEHIERLDDPAAWPGAPDHTLESDAAAVALVQAGTQPHHIKALALHVAWLLTRRRED